MIHFCSYCDQGYAARLLCLHESLCAQGEPFRLHVLCFDAATELVVRSLGLESLAAIPLTEVLAADREYASVRSGRSAVEFYFTSTPVLVRHCLERVPDARSMTYLDSDLYFFGRPSEVFREQGDAAIGIVPHRFPARLDQLKECGTYNVAWVSFQRNAEGQAAVAWWRERCLEWCHDYADHGRYADQGYLDEFPRRFRSVRALQHPGINAAPWNVADAMIATDGNRASVDGQPLLFFHFQGIREVRPGWFDPGLRTYGARFSAPLRDLIYLPYLKKLVATQRQLRAEHGIAPRLGYQRLTTGTRLKDRWQRFAVQELLPIYRRLRGQLVHCPEKSVATEPPAIPARATS